MVQAGDGDGLAWLGGYRMERNDGFQERFRRSSWQDWCMAVQGKGQCEVISRFLAWEEEWMMEQLPGVRSGVCGGADHFSNGIIKSR